MPVVHETEGLKQAFRRSYTTLTASVNFNIFYFREISAMHWTKWSDSFKISPWYFTIWSLSFKALIPMTTDEYTPLPRRLQDPTLSFIYKSIQSHFSQTPATERATSLGLKDLGTSVKDACPVQHDKPADISLVWDFYCTVSSWGLLMKIQKNATT